MWRNRKGDEDVAFESVMMIPVIILLTIMFLTYVFMTDAFIKNRTQSAAAEAAIYANRIMFAKECIAYEDGSIRRVYPGIVDLNKVSTERISNCMNFTKEEVAAAIINLSYAGNEKIAYYQEDKARIWSRLAGIAGSGSYFKYVLMNPVIVYDGNKFLNGNISVTVVVPKR